MSEPIRVERGMPTPEEVAALVGVLFALRARGPAAAGRPVLGRWVASTRPNIRLRAGLGAWRASGQPR